MNNRQAHPTKSGPGRKHGHKVSHGTPPKPAKGNWLGLHKASAEKLERCALVKTFGRRQTIKLVKAAKRATSGALA